MNIWKPVAIGCIGYIAGMKMTQNGQYVSNYYYRRRNYSPSLKDELIDIFSGKIYQLVYGETRDETSVRLRERRFGRPASYDSVYQSSGGAGESDDEDEEN